ncbi:DUF3048 domain-containing protein [Aeribacillus alveayuensis]|uniref:Lipoprotein YerB n=1 Tax=Aeribacillus alveayuensis TaxID=279215 RepID=A0ABT9VQG0_9BACI|nr:hypothetical protein [Bacillus alveayuensis]
MKRLLLSISFLSFAVLIGCSNHTGQTEEDKEKVVEQEEKQENIVLAPFTGLPAKGGIEKRPFAVMINNHPKARPQSGLHKADIVYEVLAEGNITRFLAIYQSEQPDIIGPVRSARDYYIDLSKGYKALYVSHGWSPSAKEKLESGEADYLNGLFHDGTLFWRDKERKAPHNSYISYQNIEKGAKRKGYQMTDNVAPLTFLAEDDMDKIDGDTMPEFVVKYGHNENWTVQYVYDTELERYKRYSDGELTIDRETEEPILLDNIFVVEMEHQIIDNYGRRSVDIHSGGKGYLFQHGKMLEVNWENESGRILPYKDGQIIPFVPGHTWINIVPDLHQALFISKI